LHFPEIEQRGRESNIFKGNEVVDGEGEERGAR
jgi:hypothetical protein